MSRIYIDRDKVSAVYTPEMLPLIKCQRNCEGLISGEMYSLPTESVDGIETQKRIYKLLGIVRSYRGYDIDSAIVKQVSGPQSMLFEIDRTMARELGVTYEPRITILPINMNWVHEDSNVDFVELNQDDLSSYPSQNGYINNIIIKLSGFNSFRDTHIITPNNRMLTRRNFLSSFEINYAFDIDENGPIQIGDRICHEDFDIVTNQIDTNPNRENFICDENGDIYIRINLVGKSVKAETLKNKSIHDLFRISWREGTENDVQLQNLYYQDEPIESISPTNGLIRAYNDIVEIYQNGSWHRIDKNQLIGKVDFSKPINLSSTSRSRVNNPYGMYLKWPFG